MTDKTLEKANCLKQQIVLIQEAQKIVDDPEAVAEIIVRCKYGYTYPVGQSTAINGKEFGQNVLHNVRMLLSQTLIVVKEEFVKL